MSGCQRVLFALDLTGVCCDCCLWNWPRSEACTFSLAGCDGDCSKVTGLTVLGRPVYVLTNNKFLFYVVLLYLIVYLFVYFVAHFFYSFSCFPRGFLIIIFSADFRCGEQLISHGSVSEWPVPQATRASHLVLFHLILRCIKKKKTLKNKIKTDCTLK